MKFLTKINRNYLIPIVIVILVVFIAGYYVLRLIIIYGAKEGLLSKQYLVEQQLKNGGVVPNLYPVVDVRAVGKEPGIVPSFREVSLHNEMENENEVFLEYSSQININGTWYLVKIRQSTFENEDLILILAITLLILLMASFIISFSSTRRLNRTVWAGFETNLHEIETYSLKHNKDISLSSSDIEEFIRLNTAVLGLTARLKSDYLILKEFTENASHEIQTPLAIALMNLEEILQHEVSEEVFKHVVTTTNSLKRLTALNQSLILLAKIENKQFGTVTEVSLNRLIIKKEEDLSAFIRGKKLEVEIKTEGDFTVMINEYLADILVTNILTNAINHNIEGGLIRILIRPGLLMICNTGPDNSLTDNTIFNRFAGGNHGSPGLGLAIVRQICDTHDLVVNYSKDKLHCFVIKNKS